jgi:hypothetical protein
MVEVIPQTGVIGARKCPGGSPERSASALERPEGTKGHQQPLTTERKTLYLRVFRIPSQLGQKDGNGVAGRR